MTICENFEYYLSDIAPDIQHFAQTNWNPPYNDIFSNIKYYAHKFSDISKKITKKAVLHFPKTVLIASIIHGIACLAFLSISSLISLVMNLYFLTKYQKFLFKGIRRYNALHVSEWTSPVIHKKIVIGIIDPIDQVIEKAKTLWQRLTDPLKEFMNNNILALFN